MSGAEEGAAAGGENCTMGAGTGALQIMVPAAGLKQQQRKSKSARTVVQLQSVHAFATTIQRKDAVPRCRTQNERKINGKLPLGLRDLTRCHSDRAHKNNAPKQRAVGAAQCIH